MGAAVAGLANLTVAQTAIPAASPVGRDGRANRTVDRLLSDPRLQKTTWEGAEQQLKEPNFRGQPLTKFLRNEPFSGGKEATLDELFGLQQVITGEEPELVTYHLPIGYDVLAAIRHPAAERPFDTGSLMLLMDSPPDGVLYEPKLNALKRATNGGCLLTWNTTYQRPGAHAMQALFIAQTGVHKQLLVRGPIKPYFSSNLCRFFLKGSLFSDAVAYMDARVVESNALFNIEIKTPSGTILRTVSGRTTNGLIRAEWDLRDGQGIRYTNNSFEAVFQITLPDSGRSQAVRRWYSKLGG